MNLVVDQSTNDALLTCALSRQGDPLGYNAFFSDADNNGKKRSQEDQSAEMDELVADLLLGREGCFSHARRAIGSKAGRIDAVTADLLSDTGLVPAGALLLQRAVASATYQFSMTILDGDTNTVLVDTLGYATEWEVLIDASNQITWQSVGHINMPLLPVTIGTAAIGRPLRHLVAHPMLDQHDLTIVSVDNNNTQTRLTVTGPALAPNALLDVDALERVRKTRMPLAA